MKASSLFALTVAGLLGLGAVAGAKYAGVFDRADVKPEAKAQPTKVLVASQNIFEGITVTSSQVKLRDLRPEEVAQYEKNKDKYMPALVAAAHMRVAARSIEADTPLLKEYFQDQALPDEISRGMNRYMRAVNVSVPKERCNGGLLRVGEYVDIILTSQIAGAKDADPVLQTTCLARGVKIIVKRNNLWTTLVSNPGDLPISFTLMANPYRAELIEFAKTAGNLTMMPAPQPPEDQVRRSNNARPIFSDPNSREYRDEDERVAKVERGELVIGSRDLERIFRLQPIPLPVPAPVMKQDVVVNYNGLQQGRVTLLPAVEVKPPVKPDDGARRLPNSDGKVRPAATDLTASIDQPALGYRFYLPDVIVPVSTTADGKPRCLACEAAEAAKAAAAKKKARGG